MLIMPRGIKGLIWLVSKGEGRRGRGREGGREEWERGACCHTLPPPPVSPLCVANCSAFLKCQNAAQGPLIA